ncbi:hypothetical protein EJ02DRAFT_430908 [Clathrospora elynae]|uniref:Uncharacterized protein n=1 Tax=Clathrospora elynae TaxID=706981 RepID=A0A6A5T008_9PLEO|nr:hypothetical protein EJ02DRAFT_430908 [Clathrospora elynae]
MAEVGAPGSQAKPVYASQNAPHGTKRAADSSLEHEQRLSKRFDLLNLVNNSGTRLYIPVPGSTDATLSRPPASPIAIADPLAFVPARLKRDRRYRPPPAGDGMQVEDTPHRVYITDLAAELSDIESDEDTPIFLSDIEKHLSKIPKHVLLGPEPKPTENNQVVLYNVPTSLTVPEAQDSVRKAIVEARQRIRYKQGNPNKEPDRVVMGSVPPVQGHEDDDAMDID